MGVVHEEACPHKGRWRGATEGEKSEWWMMSRTDETGHIFTEPRAAVFIQRAMNVRETDVGRPASFDAMTLGPRTGNKIYLPVNSAMTNSSSCCYSCGLSVVTRSTVQHSMADAAATFWWTTAPVPPPLGPAWVTQSSICQPDHYQIAWRLHIWGKSLKLFFKKKFMDL